MSADDPGGAQSLTTARSILSLILRSILLLISWWGLTEGSAGGWLYAGVVCVLAASVSLALLPPGRGRPRPLALARFAATFLREMFLGGVDVARRALHPSLPIEPGFIRHPLRVRGSAARVLLTLSAGLLPGTVSVRLRQEELELHVLDVAGQFERTVVRLETRIAGLVGETPLSPED